MSEEAKREDGLGLAGKVAIVTGDGAADDGIGNGRAAAILLARAGARVLVVDLDRAQAECTVAMIAQEGGTAAAFIADVTDEKQARAMVDAALAQFGRLDCLDNNVGIGGRGSVVEVSPQDWRRVMQVNVDSMFMASRHAIPAMKRTAGGGAIVNISSIWGSVHNASAFSDHADTFTQNHPEWHQNATQFQQNRFNEANTLQSNRFNEANTLQSNRYNEANSLQSNRINTWNNYNGNWGGYYSGLGFGAGFAIGATVAALPAAAAAISVAGDPYYYADGVYYAPQGGQYAVVPPPQGAVVTNPPPSCSSVNLGGGGTGLDCGGAFYAPVAAGYQVIPPPIGATTWTLPNGAVDQNVNGTTYFAYGGAYYRPIYSGSGVYYEVVGNPA